MTCGCLHRSIGTEVEHCIYIDGLYEHYYVRKDDDGTFSFRVPRSAHDGGYRHSGYYSVSMMSLDVAYICRSYREDRRRGLSW